MNTCIEVIKTLSSGGFKLTKFISNSPKILKELLRYGVSQKHAVVDLDLQKTSIQRTLGILWDMESGLLKLKTIQKDITMTKRSLLSSVSSIFDPLGILTLTIIEPKQIIQLSWQIKINWDNPVPLDLEIRWKNWLTNLSKINHISLPRWYGFTFVNTSCIELHIFAVASNSAFGTVAIFIYKKQDTVKCSFGLSKSHLIPANSKISIPRLELQAAVMATRLKVSLLEEIKENITQLFLLSDSKTVLNHLRNKDREILEIIKHTESTKHTITQHLMIGIMY